jgi:hypothetical protein
MFEKPKFFKTEKPNRSLEKNRMPSPRDDFVPVKLNGARMGNGFRGTGPAPPALLLSLVGFNFYRWFPLSSASDISSGSFLKMSVEIIFLHAVS